MDKKVLEDKIRASKEFLELWLQLHKQLKRVKKEAEINREAEMEFLKLKSNLARKHTILMRRLGKDYVNGERITPYLQRLVTLRNLHASRPETHKDLEKNWNIIFIRLHETLGQLRYFLGDE